MKNQIYITKEDFNRLTNLIEGMATSAPRVQKSLGILEHELDRAIIVDSHDIPPDIVTLHSAIILRDLGSRISTSYKLVLPSEANSSTGSLSILAPIGIAVIGYGEGDSFDCEAPGGRRQFLVEKVTYQPESAPLQSQHSAAGAQYQRTPGADLHAAPNANF